MLAHTQLELAEHRAQLGSQRSRELCLNRRLSIAHKIDILIYAGKL
jgi:hypothetical protein